MVNESFVDVCFTILLNKKATEKIKKTTYRDILDVIKFYKKKAAARKDCRSKCTTLLFVTLCLKPEKPGVGLVLCHELLMCAEL